MNRRTQLIFCVFLCCTMMAFSQAKPPVKTTSINKDVDVTKVYEQVVKEGYGTPFIYKELANAYYFKSNYPKAKQWFEALFTVEKPTDETLRFRYKQTLKALRLYNEKNVYLSHSGESN